MIIVTISSFSRSVDARGARGSDIPHPRHVYRVEFIRERCYAIGRRESIIYLGNYSEAGSTPPVAREPQIIECKLSLFSAAAGRARPDENR